MKSVQRGPISLFTTKSQPNALWDYISPLMKHYLTIFCLIYHFKEFNMKYLIQHNLMNEDQLLEVKSAVANIPHQFVGLIPFTREITSDFPIEGDEYIPYGSTLLTTLGFDLYSWKGLYFDLNNFDYQKALSNRNDMLNTDMVLPIEEVIEFLTERPASEDWFVRPSLDLKQFSGTVIAARECIDWLKDAMECDSSGSYKINKGTMVVVSKPKVIQAEWRWFVVGGKVVTGSMYRCRGQLRKERAVEKDLFEEAQDKANGWLPNSCCVMDLALVNNELKVIEFNCINSSGFYDHDIELTFKSLYYYSISQ